MFDPFSDNLCKLPPRASLDYHNAKYHGNLLGQKPNGLGLLLDHNYLLAISRWQQTKANGPTTVLYCDGTLFQGNVLDFIPDGLCTYFPKKNFQIYSLFTREDGMLVSIDSKQTFTLHFLKIDQAMVQILMRQRDENRLLSEFQKNEGQRVKMMDQKKYVSQGSRIDYLQQYFKREVKEVNNNFRTYIVENFGTSRKNNQEILDVVETKEEFQFGFKGSSITCKMSLDSPVTAKTLGYFNNDFNSFEICRKDNNSGNIQEVIGTIVFEYPKVPQQRSNQCISLLHKYYKQSLDFQNKNFNIDYLYKVKFIFLSLQQLFNGISTLELAQRLLQNPKEVQQTRSKGKMSSQKEDFSYYAIEQVSEDIYEAINRKKRRSLGNSQNRSKSQKKGQRKNYSPNKTFIINRHLDHSAPNVNAFHFIYPQMLKNDEKNRLQIKKQNQTFQATPLFERSRKRSPLSKYAYLEKESDKVNEKRIKEMKTLTQYYEDIQRETRKRYSFETPAKKNSHNKNSIVHKVTNSSDLSGSKGPKRRLIYGWD